MKKFFIVSLYLLCFLPTLAYGNNNQCNNLNFNACYNVGGCYLDDIDGCSQCSEGYYWPQNQSCNDSEGCACFSCGSDFTYPTNATYDAEHTTQGQSSCPWKCESNYYKTGESCTHCPTNSTTNSSGATSINDCKCNSGYYMGGNNNNTCLSCPEHAECVLTGLTYTTITCTRDYSPVIDSQQHTVTCVRSCTDAHATIGSDNMCRCNSGYYGMPAYHDTICTKCPAGTTSNSGSTTISACHMTADTKFCVSDSNNCMNLLNFGSSTAFDNTNMVIR